METLEIYDGYLKEHLKFPFKASFDQETGPFQTETHHVNCLRLDRVIQVDDKYGILMEGRIGR